MALDWQAVLQDATSAALGVVQSKTPEIRDYLRQTADAHFEALRSYGEARITDQIDQQTFDSLMDDEKIVLHAEFMAVSIMVKAAAQKAANAFVNSIMNAVKVALLALV